ncbi:hypothetical protein [Flavobacterium sp. GSB-24]|uniref:hypothetical protein n=1 Tax=Flavobacterium sp. GSB-24 TaxID=2994319 RepID=UPI0024910A3B|nr:hypothetical protein [Flavobacterium sp. GSB-24]BDU26399.1 hypothetical protein FLGSB24_31430 [Flavobacterium sp. GSB-24]
MTQFSKSHNLVNDVVFTKFKTQLENNGININSVDEEDFIYIAIDGSELKISLENVRRNYERDSDDKHISDLVEVIVSHSSKPLKWGDIKNNVYIQLVPKDFEFENLIHEKVTNEFSKVFIINSDTSFSFITEDDLIDWKLDLSELKRQVDLNLDLLLSKIEIEVEDVHNHKLGMINIPDIWLKSSCLFSLKIKNKVEDNIGFPFYAVIPVRDFCYIFGEEDFKYFSECLGSVVLDEYEKSGYPITTEILKFSETGVEAIGKY